MTESESGNEPAPGSRRRITAAEAIVDGITAEMAVDPSVTRVASIGHAFDAAADGSRPVAEVSVDGTEPGLDPNHHRLASHPMVLVTVVGGAVDDGGHPGPCRWATYARLPGLKVVAPSNPYDAKGLIVAAIRDDGPVVYLSHRGVLDGATAEVPDAVYAVPIGRAAVARPGTDVTVVTLSWPVRHALEVAGSLAGEGIETEVIDLRSLVPLDREAIVASVARTGRLVVVDEDNLAYGLSGEVAATVTDADPSLLRAPVKRVCHPQSRVPPDPDPAGRWPGRIEAAIREVLAS
jgi:acetoin:2,6-dichlorophenolindophenol oxidoreductase subunit beta